MATMRVDDESVNRIGDAGIDVELRVDTVLAIIPDECGRQPEERHYEGRSDQHGEGDILIPEGHDRLRRQAVDRMKSTDQMSKTRQRGESDGIPDESRQGAV